MKLKQILFNSRLHLCEKQKSKPWNMNHLEAAVKELKKDKARDPNGWLNDLFMIDIAGTNLKISILNCSTK